MVTIPRERQISDKDGDITGTGRVGEWSYYPDRQRSDKDGDITGTDRVRQCPRETDIR